VTTERLVDQHLHVRVVLGQLVQPALTQQVGAGVADVRHGGPGAREQHGGQGGAHALQRAVGLDLLGDAAVGDLERLVQRVHLVVVVDRHVESGHRLDGEPAREVARGHSTHAVGDDEEAVTGVVTVLVVAPDMSLIGAGRPPQVQGHGVQLPRSSQPCLHAVRGVSPEKGVSWD
jgi:hypothetical protein